MFIRGVFAFFIVLFSLSAFSADPPCITDAIEVDVQPSPQPLLYPDEIRTYELRGNNYKGCTVPDKYRDKQGRFTYCDGMVVLPGTKCEAFPDNGSSGVGGTSTPPSSGGSSSGQKCFNATGGKSFNTLKEACASGGFPRYRFHRNDPTTGRPVYQCLSKDGSPSYFYAGPNGQCDSKPSPDSEPEAPKPGQCVSFQGKFYRSPAAACATVGLSFEGHHVRGREYRCGKGTGHQIFFVDCPPEDKPKDGKDGQDGKGEKGEKGEDGKDGQDGKDAEGGDTVNNTTNNTTNNNTTNINQGNGEGGQFEDKNDMSDFCKANPKALACLNTEGLEDNGGDLSDLIPRKEIPISFNPGNGILGQAGAGVCPAPETVSLRYWTFVLDWTTVCLFLAKVRGVVIAIFSVFGMFIIFKGMK